MSTTLTSTNAFPGMVKPLTQQDAEHLLGNASFVYHALNLKISDILMDLSDVLVSLMEEHGGDDMQVWESFVEAAWHGFIAKNVEPDIALYEAYDAFLSFGPEFIDTYVKSGEVFVEGLLILYRPLAAELRRRNLTAIRMFTTMPQHDYEMIMVVVECIDSTYPSLPQLIDEGFVTPCTLSYPPTGFVGMGSIRPF